MKAALALAVAVCAASHSFGAVRSHVPLRNFQRHHPCPLTGAARGACPGFEIDHVIALCLGGPDEEANLQWLSHQAHREKTTRDVAACRLRRTSP